jgi:hypothetical protein
LRFVPFGSALGKFSLELGKLTFEIGYPLLIGSGECAVTRRAHLRTSSGPTFRVDHTVPTPAGHHRLSIGTIGGASANDSDQQASSVPLVRRTVQSARP